MVVYVSRYQLTDPVFTLLHSTAWVVDEIVSSSTSDQRAGIIASFINISQACIALRNYNTAFAIVAGLDSASVSRLKGSWEKLSKKRYVTSEPALSVLMFDRAVGRDLEPCKR